MIKNYGALGFLKSISLQQQPQDN